MNLIKQKQAAGCVTLAPEAIRAAPVAVRIHRALAVTPIIFASSQARPFVLQSFPLGLGQRGMCLGSLSGFSFGAGLMGLGWRQQARPLAVEGRCAFRVNPL